MASVKWTRHGPTRRPRELALRIDSIRRREIQPLSGPGSVKSSIDANNQIQMDPFFELTD